MEKNKTEIKLLYPSSLISSEEKEVHEIDGFITAQGRINKSEFGIHFPNDYYIKILVEKNSTDILKRIQNSGIYFDLKIDSKIFRICYVNKYKIKDKLEIKEKLYYEEFKIIYLRVE